MLNWLDKIKLVKNKNKKEVKFMADQSETKKRAHYEKPSIKKKKKV